MDATSNRYDMPAVFGPSLMTDKTRTTARVVMVSFETTRDAAARLLPRFFDAAEQPVVSFSRITYDKVDYLGGRPYQEVVLGVSAIYANGGRQIAANFAPVMWVDEVGALIAGREFQGLAKLSAQFTPLVIGAEARFSISEYGAPLFEGAATSLVPITGDKLERLNEVGGAVNTLGWKYIPGLAGAPDADYPTLSVMRWAYEKAWSGQSNMRFFAPDSTAAPFSSRIVAALAALPMVAMKRSFVGEGRAVIDRTATERLPA